MNLTLKIKLLPSPEQANSLLQTIKDANKACNTISNTAWHSKVFNQFKIHKAVYHTLKGSTNLSAQVLVRCISKVADAYKLDKKTKRIFKALGAITYDSRILTYKENTASIWSVAGRLKIPFVCHNKSYLPYIKGEADLLFKNGKYYLFQNINVPDEDVKDVEEFIGCDFGQVDVCTLSDGTNYNSEQLKKVRKKYSKVRASVQSKGTRGARKLLKRLSGRERRFVTINNHTISKQIIAKAKGENRGIAIEDLRNIRKTATPKSKAQRTELNRWGFSQLREFIEYKAKLNGVKVSVIPPAYTSKTCSDCLHIGERAGKNFNCKNCGNASDADYNAAKNIAAWGFAINKPERSILYCSTALHN